MLKYLLSFVLLWLVVPSDPIPVWDVDGRLLGDLRKSNDRASVLFFITDDCPVSNRFAPEIQRICRDNEPFGVQCYLVYVDPDLTAERIHQHLEDFGHRTPAILDDEHRLVQVCGATITPEACVLSPTGEILYRGRINNLYERLGRSRRHVTKHDLRRALDQIRQSQAVVPARTQAVGCFIPTELTEQP